MKSYEEHMLGMSIESTISIIKYGVKHYTAELKNELRYIRKKCKLAAKGKSIGSYADFAMNEMAISSTCFQIMEYLKDCREMLNKNLLAYDNNSFKLTNDEINRVLKLFYKGVQELNDLEWIMKCIKCNYEIMRVVIAHPGQKRP
jgi:hypothetical protein